MLLYIIFSLYHWALKPINISRNLRYSLRTSIPESTFKDGIGFWKIFYNLAPFAVAMILWTNSSRIYFDSCTIIKIRIFHCKVNNDWLTCLNRSTVEQKSEKSIKEKEIKREGRDTSFLKRTSISKKNPLDAFKEHEAEERHGKR